MTQPPASGEGREADRRRGDSAPGSDDRSGTFRNNAPRSGAPRTGAPRTGGQRAGGGYGNRDRGSYGNRDGGSDFRGGDRSDGPRFTDGSGRSASGRGGGYGDPRGGQRTSGRQGGPGAGRSGDRAGAPRFSDAGRGGPSRGRTQGGNDAAGGQRSGGSRSGRGYGSGYSGGSDGGAGRSRFGDDAGSRGGFSRGGGSSRGGAGNPRSSGPQRGGASGNPRSGGPQRGGASGNPRSGGPQRGGASGGQRSGGSRGAGASRNAQPGFAKKGPKPFAHERFGKDVKPAARPSSSSSSHPKHRGTATPPPSGPLARPERLHSSEGERLQKIMAHAGVASRRLCEEMIEAGRVEVDGQIVRELGIRVDPQRSVIHVDGIRIQVDETLHYLVFNKPAGVVSTMDDPEGRPAIADFLKKTPERLFHVGRLDVATEGLLLLTNDGELANRLTHPSFEVPKTYLVQVRGPLPKGVGAQLKDGVELDDGFASLDSFRLIDSKPGHVLIEVVLHSGRNRIVRRLFDAVGHPVERLVRVKLGPIALGDQKQGTVRALGRQEAGVLLASVGL